ncbi:MAG: phosphotransferase [Tolypothrix carrinoi HA7290-LM1]|jgi:thiamine kinase-like enzyme|nr:phosphotransferase [Tolypothrix carrinoi HA7290-LM1]
MSQDSPNQKVSSKSPDDKPNRSILTKRAIDASVSVASSYGINIDDPYVLADAYSVRIHLRPAPIVARVSTITCVLRSPIDSWLAREISVAEFLFSQGVPVVPPSDMLPPLPHEHDGLFISFWRYVQPLPDAVPKSAVVGEMLAELHSVLRDYPEELPFLAPPLNDIPRGLERLDRIGNILSKSDLVLLRSTYEKLLSQVKNNSVNSLQPLHGDGHTHNLIPTAKGLLWNDFEDTCNGSIAWDLINLDEEGRAAYPNAPESAILEPYRRLRQLHGIVWVYALLPEFPNWLEFAQAMLDDLRDYQ